MRIEIRRSTRNFVILVAILVVMVQGAMAPPTNEPSYIPPSGVIIVDGNIGATYSYGEWDLTNDFFADMYESANNNGKDTVLSKLYLRYDCGNEILYAMVQVVDGYMIDESNTEDEDHYIKANISISSGKLVDESYGNIGDAPNFQFISNSNNELIGWEASAPISAGSYELNVHTQVNDGDTSAVLNRSIPLVINCGTNDIPEFPTIALPVAAILGLMFIFGRKRDL